MYIIGAGIVGISIANEIKSKGIFGCVIAFLVDDPEKITYFQRFNYFLVEYGIVKTLKDPLISGEFQEVYRSYLLYFKLQYCDQ